jgi:site-specific DNA-methyltransferase (adenine-specific)
LASSRRCKTLECGNSSPRFGFLQLAFFAARFFGSRESGNPLPHAKMAIDPAPRDWRDLVLCGDALGELRRMPDALADCIITSPPYYRQREYRGPKEIGQEDTPQEYVERLTAVFREARRVLKQSGTCWLVLGDKYDRGRLLGMPWRVALALMDDGWILRRDIIWHKPNAMPSAAKNRPTVDHEYVFLFVRSPDYYYNADAVREPHVTFGEHSRMKGGRKHFHRRGGTPEAGKNGGQINLHDGRWDQAFHPLGRNKRTVWSIPLSKFREAHFAVFPEALVETCLAAGCPEGGLVLDPFLGSGATAVAARKLGRCYVGIDCVSEYCAMARRRIENVSRNVDSPADNG